jgi:hypothetical protein
MNIILSFGRPLITKNKINLIKQNLNQHPFILFHFYYYLLNKIYL